MTFGLKNVSKNMTHKNKIQTLKLFIKISIVCCVLVIFILFGFFIKPVRTFENANMKKWLTLSEQDKILTIQRVVPNAENQDLLIDCITKISNLANSNEMIIRDATVLCYNGIKFSELADKQETTETDEE